MGFCGTQILELSNDLYQEIGSPPNISIGYISGFLSQSGTLGKLNNGLGTCYFFSGDCIIAGFGGQEQALYGELFKQSYYQQQIMTFLGAGSWTRLEEGDSKITRSNAAKDYQDLLNSSLKYYRFAIADWKRNHTIPGDIVAEPLASWPSP